MMKKTNSNPPKADNLRETREQLEKILWTLIATRKPKVRGGIEAHLEARDAIIALFTRGEQNYDNYTPEEIKAMTGQNPPVVSTDKELEAIYRRCDVSNNRTENPLSFEEFQAWANQWKQRAVLAELKPLLPGMNAHDYGVWVRIRIAERIDQLQKGKQ